MFILRSSADPYTPTMKSDEAINCPSCGKPMRLRQLNPGFGTLPELRTYECTSCGIVKTEQIDTKEVP